MLLRLLLLLLLLLLLPRISGHDGRDAKVGGALAIRVAVVVEIVQEAAVRRRAGTLVAVVARAAG